MGATMADVAGRQAPSTDKRRLPQEKCPQGERSGQRVLALRAKAGATFNKALVASAGPEGLLCPWYAGVNPRAGLAGCADHRAASP
jgi:hypothetical protein